jgi:cold shock CspA family protein
MHKGQLKSWKDDKGFGFIQSSELKQDTFIHISTLKAMSRKPKVGDFIYFDVENQANGKSKAVNCRIEGVAAKAIQRHKPRIHRNTSAPKNKLVLILVVIGIGAFAFQRLGLAPSNKPAQHTPITTESSGSLLNRAFSDTNANFSCDGRQHCSQMTSRAEAEYFIKHCPNTKMDGDRDGIPCENDSRF